MVSKAKREMLNMPRIVPRAAKRKLCNHNHGKFNHRLGLESIVSNVDNPSLEVKTGEMSKLMKRQPEDGAIGPVGCGWPLPRDQHFHLA